jgi:hypothetical protein
LQASSTANMEARLSVSTIAYLAEQEKLVENQKIVAQQEKIEQEKHKREQAEYLKIKSNLPYTEPLALEICERISSGELLINICLDEHLPTVRRCNQWLQANDEFLHLYKQSIDDRLSIFEEQVAQIADDVSKDFRIIIKNGQERRIPDPDMVARAKLRIEVRFRHLKAGRPQKWGEISTLNLKTDDGLNSKDMSMEELVERINRFEPSASRRTP